MCRAGVAEEEDFVGQTYALPLTDVPGQGKEGAVLAVSALQQAEEWIRSQIGSAVHAEKTSRVEGDSNQVDHPIRDCRYGLRVVRGGVLVLKPKVFCGRRDR